LGWMFPPILKFLGFLENRGLLTPLWAPLAPAEAVTTFLPLVIFLGYEIGKVIRRLR